MISAERHVTTTGRPRAPSRRRGRCGWCGATLCAPAGRPPCHWRAFLDIGRTVYGLHRGSDISRAARWHGRLTLGDPDEQSVSARASDGAGVATGRDLHWVDPHTALILDLEAGFGDGGRRVASRVAAAERARPEDADSVLGPWVIAGALTTRVRRSAAPHPDAGRVAARLAPAPDPGQCRGPDRRRRHRTSNRRRVNGRRRRRGP